MPVLTLNDSIAVEAVDLTKRYRLGNLSSLSRTLAKLAKRPSRLANADFEALSGVNFTVNRGETIGIVGTNGSGKSTFLQILSGTTLPTGGQLRVRGSVLPLLAVGLGFHPDLTGRENVVLFGASVGVAIKTIRERMDAVIDFAGVRTHIDTPVKRYSSGMVSRLSVAVAVQFPADIYVFDEVLAVVDAEFRDRCFAEIKTMHQQGRTVFFVSHHAEQVAELCDRVIWLERGRVKQIGLPAEVLEAYHEAHHVSQV